MRTFHDEANRRRRAAAQQAKATFVDMSLAGFRRPYHEGTSHKRESVSAPTSLAGIKLDGFERSIEVTFTVWRDTEGRRGLRGCCVDCSRPRKRGPSTLRRISRTHTALNHLARNRHNAHLYRKVYMAIATKMTSTEAESFNKKLSVDWSHKRHALHAL